MVPPSVLAEAQTIRAESRALWAKATESMTHNAVGEQLCDLLNCIDALEGKVPHAQWSNPEGNAVGEDLRHLLMDLLGAEYEGSGG